MQSIHHHNGIFQRHMNILLQIQSFNFMLFHVCEKNPAASSSFYVVINKFIYINIYISNRVFYNKRSVLSSRNEFRTAKFIRISHRHLSIFYCTARPRFEQHCWRICLPTFIIEIIGRMEVESHRLGRHEKCFRFENRGSVCVACLVFIL